LVDNNWQKQALALNATGTMSRRSIAELLGIPRSTCLDYLRDYSDFFNADIKEDEKDHDNSRILVISDMHLPYSVKGLVPFLQGLKDKYSPTRVICIGDEIDYHANSFHDSDPDLMSAGYELRKSLETIELLHEMFPRMNLLESNHGSMIHRKAKHHGIPRHHIKSYNEVLGVGDGWSWHEDMTLIMPDGKPVYFHHGKTADGIKLSQTMGMSCVQGHHHNEFSTRYWANSLGLYFSLQVGCLIDNDSYAFAYNNVNLKKPIIGSALICEGIPVLEAFPL
jgi:hypothetical protein